MDRQFFLKNKTGGLNDCGGGQHGSVWPTHGCVFVINYCLEYDNKNYFKRIIENYHNKSNLLISMFHTGYYTFSCTNLAIRLSKIVSFRHFYVIK